MDTCKGGGIRPIAAVCETYTSPLSGAFCRWPPESALTFQCAKQRLGLAAGIALSGGSAKYSGDRKSRRRTRHCNDRRFLGTAD